MTKYAYSFGGGAADGDGTITKAEFQTAALARFDATLLQHAFAPPLLLMADHEGSSGPNAIPRCDILAHWPQCGTYHWVIIEWLTIEPSSTAT